jgi:uncharacterized membrane protein
MEKRFNYIIYGFSLFAVCLLTCRIFKTESLIYIFLVWNLFLAFIPYWISSHLSKLEQLKYFHLPLIIMWVLFLPNCPYIITDLFHLKHRDPIPYWYDLVLVYSFALIGFVLFYRSVFDILKLIRNRIPQLYLNFILPAFFWLVAFGLYLGRYLRFNSWNVVNHPFRVAHKSFDALFCKDTIGFTLIFAAFMWFVYLTLVNFNSKEKI